MSFSVLSEKFPASVTSNSRSFSFEACSHLLHFLLLHFLHLRQLYFNQFFVSFLLLLQFLFLVFWHFPVQLFNRSSTNWKHNKIGKWKCLFDWIIIFQFHTATCQKPIRTMDLKRLGCPWTMDKRCGSWQKWNKTHLPATLMQSQKKLNILQDKTELYLLNQAVVIQVCAIQKHQLPIYGCGLRRRKVIYFLVLYPCGWSNIPCVNTTEPAESKTEKLGTFERHFLFQSRAIENVIWQCGESKIIYFESTTRKKCYYGQVESVHASKIRGYVGSNTPWCHQTS